MPISELAMDYMRRWVNDLKIKGFKDVELVQARLPYIEAKRPDGLKMKGFAAFAPKDLDIKLWSGIEEAFDDGYVVFLVVPDEMVDSAEDCLRVWKISDKVFLQSVMKRKED
ncbi:MAG: hypothetical protein HPY73_00410 [Methanomassiliicoccales archaeon]|nr:MAG: hypothetical protein HPY73_00410 [Methanomassiliicoccales archaeon]